MTNKEKNYWTGIGMIKSMKSSTIYDKHKDKEYVVMDMSLSIRDVIKGKEKFTLVPIECWDVMASACQEFDIGDIVKVEGHFANKKWKDGAENEQKRNVIVMESIGRAK